MNRFCMESCWVVLIALVSVMSDGYGVISAAAPRISNTVKMCIKLIQSRYQAIISIILLLFSIPVRQS